MEFISNRNVVVRSKNTGHAIGFKKGVPQYVPAQMYNEVMEKGILPVEDGKPVDPEKNEVIKPEVKVLLAPEDGFERDAKILEVIEAIVKRNAPGDFAGGGHPAASAISAVLGWRVDQKAVKKVWEANRQQVLNPVVE